MLGRDIREVSQRKRCIAERRGPGRKNMPEPGAGELAVRREEDEGRRRMRQK